MAHPKKRGRFKSRQVNLLTCEGVNFDHDEGELAVAITIESKGNIEPLAMTMDDARKLVTHLLIALWTNDDEFAESVLTKSFPFTRDGQYYWPETD